MEQKNSFPLVFETDKNKGLSNAEYLLRLKKFGLNEIKEKERFKFIKFVLRQFESPLVLILVFAALFSLIFLKDIADSFIIFFVVILNAAIGIFQEGHSSRIFEKLKEHINSVAIVIREGKQKEIPALNVVPGDVLILRSGNRVAADGRIIEERNLEINEAILTGEWQAQKKETGSKVFLGTLVENGYGKIIVASTGENTEFGKIAHLLRKEKSGQTPLQKGTKKLAKIIALVAVAAAFLIFFFGLLKGWKANEMFLLATAVAVASVPEGLPAAVSAILAIGSKRILKKKGLIKKIIAAETLGSTEIILTDKTGTLTQAKMELSAVKTANSFYTNSRKINIQENREVLFLFKAAVFANEAFIETLEEKPENIILKGNPTGKALLLAGLKAGINLNDLAQKEPRIDFLPFDSKKRLNVSLHKEDGVNRLYAIGEPEKIIRQSAKIFNNSAVLEFTAEAKKNFMESLQNFTQQGARVLAGAYKQENINDRISEKEPFDNLVFLGLFAFEDPLREDVKQAVDKIQKAGVKVVIVTGDHPETAKTIAVKLGLKKNKEEVKIAEGAISPEELEKSVLETDVFARILPQDKLKIVQAMQEKGFSVAMIGDGVNDALALKKANIGAVVGSGTDVAKEASSLILISDNFSIITSAIEEGRIIIDNLRKIIVYLLSTSFSEIILVVGGLLMGLPSPVLAGQIIWANIIEEGFMNFAFAFEPKEAGLMERRPKDYSLTNFLTKDFVKIILAIGLTTSFLLLGLFFGLYYLGYEITKIRTIIFASLSMDALFFAFSIKNLKKPIWKINIFSNLYLVAAWLISLTLLLSAIFLGPLRNLLKLTPVFLPELFLIFTFGFLNLLIIEITKWLIAKK